MKRASKLGLWISGLALTSLALVLVYRAPILESLLNAALTYREVPGALSVESVSLNRTAIADVSLGAADEVQVERVTLTYGLPGLLAGRLQGLAVDGLRLKLDLRDGAPPLGSLQNLAAGGDGGDAQAVPALPPITLRNARVEAWTPLGPIAGRVEGTLNPGAEGGFDATLRFDLQGEAGRLRGMMTATQAAEGSSRARFDLADGAINLPGAELRGLQGDGSFSLLGSTIETAQLDLTLGEVAVPGASFEQARVALNLAGERLEIDAGLASADGHFAVIAKADLSDFPAHPKGRINLDAEIGVQAVLWPLLDIPPPSKGRAVLAMTLEGRLPPMELLIGGETDPLTALKPEDFTGQASLRLDGIDYPGLVKGLAGELRLAARPGPDFPKALAADVALDLRAARLTWDDTQARKIAISHKVKLDVSDLKITVTSNDIGAISIGNLDMARAIEARIAKVSLTAARGAAISAAGSVALTDGSFTVPAYDVTVEGLNATVEKTKTGDIGLAFKLDTLRHPAVAPIRLQGEARKSGDVLTFRVRGHGPDGLGAVKMTGRHHVSKGTGAARIGLVPLTFVPGSAQPRDLFPALADLSKVEGTVRGEADVTWARAGVTGSAALKIEDLSLESAAARIEGLALDLALNEIQPPGSLPGQVLRMRRLDPGIPIDDLTVHFQVLAGDTPAIAVARAGLRLAGGRFGLADVVVDPAQRRQDLPVTVEDLDLAEVFSLLGIEGLSGDGRLSGTIPLAVTDGIPRIEGGHLSAREPGILRIKSDYANEALASAGESAELLLSALEDFHYEELNLAIDQPSEDLATIGLSLLGMNPAVLDGHPFRFNVNLETDPRRLLKTLQEAFRISKRAIGQMWMFGP